MLSLLPFLAPILLQHRVATVEAVVRELAEKTGRPLAIRSEMRDEVVDARSGRTPPTSG